MASFFSAFFFLRRLAHLMARVHSAAMRSGRLCDLPVALSRPAKTRGSMAPSSSGSATCSATCTGCTPRSESSHSSVVWNTRGRLHR